MIVKKNQILTIRNHFIAQHCWPEAPEEVEFLKSLHRHVFHVITKIPTNGDRQIEFFMAQTRIRQFLVENYDNKILGRKSCETMAHEIGSFIMELYDLKEIEVEVNEDGENGSTVVLERISYDDLQLSPAAEVDTTPSTMNTIVDTEQVLSRVRNIGQALNENYKDMELQVLYTQEAMMYVADLSKYMPDVNLSFYCNAEHLLASELTSSRMKDKHILIVMGAVGEGESKGLSRLVKIAAGCGVGSVATSVLFDKTSTLVADYICLKANSPITEQVAGYGLTQVSFGHKRCLFIKRD